MQISNDFMSGGCNPVYKGMAWTGDLVAYACHSQIYLTCFSDRKVLVTLPAHAKRVQSLIIIQQEKTTFLLSVGAEGNLVVYKNE